MIIPNRSKIRYETNSYKLDFKNLNKLKDCIKFETSYTQVKKDWKELWKIYTWWYITQAVEFIEKEENIKLDDFWVKLHWDWIVDIVIKNKDKVIIYTFIPSK